LRRWHELRSLKIPQGLLQVSSRRCERPAIAAAMAREASAARQSPVEPDFLTYAGNYWVFCDNPAQEQRTNRANAAVTATRTQLRQNCSTSQQLCLDHFELSRPSQIYNMLTGVFAGR
jgi:hypothetical protein